MDTKKYEHHINIKNKRIPIILHLPVSATASLSSYINWHENIELLYCVGGNGTVICDTVEYKIKEGDIFFVNSNDMHDVITDSFLKYSCLIIDSEFLRENGIEVEKLKIENIIKSENAVSLYNRLMEEYTSDCEFNYLSIRSIVLELMACLLKKHAKKENEKKSHSQKEDNIKFALNYIKANYTQKITLDNVADEVGLNKYYFAHEFKKITGMTFIAYINHLRCNQAKQLLLKKKHFIREIADMCGFDNASYFAKIFKLEVGCLPSEYGGLNK